MNTQQYIYFYEDGKIVYKFLTKNSIIIRIGRDTTNNVVFQDKTVSGQHAHIEIKDGIVYLMDDDSTNGTLVQHLYWKLFVFKIKLLASDWFSSNIIIYNYSFFNLCFY
jgi:hypothetical protein